MYYLFLNLLMFANVLLLGVSGLTNTVLSPVVAKELLPADLVLGITYQIRSGVFVSRVQPFVHYGLLILYF